MNQLKQGIRIEHEHKDLYRIIKNCRSPCRISEKKFYGTIAKAHLKEHKNYYKKLKEARL